MLNLKERDFDVVIVGAGIAGAVLAERYSNQGKRVLVVEKKNHIGGKSYDYRNENGTIVSDYGSQLFHTNDDTIWNYVNLFASWRPWTYRVAAFDKYQYMPSEGFTPMFNNMLSHPNITVLLNTDYFDIKDELRSFEKLYYTGPVGKFYTFRNREEKFHSGLNFVSETINGTLVGGLAQDVNYNMDQAIKNALDIYYEVEENQVAGAASSGLKIAS